MERCERSAARRWCRAHHANVLRVPPTCALKTASMANSVFCTLRHRREQGPRERGRERSERASPAPPRSPVQAPQLAPGRLPPGLGPCRNGVGPRQPRVAAAGAVRAGPGSVGPSAALSVRTRAPLGLGRAPGTRPGVRGPRASAAPQPGGPGRWLEPEVRVRARAGRRGPQKGAEHRLGLRAQAARGPRCASPPVTSVPALRPQGRRTHGPPRPPSLASCPAGNSAGSRPVGDGPPQRTSSPLRSFFT